MSDASERPPSPRNEEAGPPGAGAILEAVSFAAERVFRGMHGDPRWNALLRKLGFDS